MELHCVGKVVPAPGSRVRLGLDESGRGNVVGPMVVVAWVQPLDGTTGVPGRPADCKTLSDKQLKACFVDLFDGGACIVCTLTAQFITEQQRSGVNLNQLSYMAAAACVKHVVQTQRLCVVEVVADNVGDCSMYEHWVREAAQSASLVFQVSPKAESRWREVAAASVVAKYVVDAWFRTVARSAFPDIGKGSPSPSDKTMAWVAAHLADGCPGNELVRHEWKNVRALAAAGTH